MKNENIIFRILTINSNITPRPRQIGRERQVEEDYYSNGDYDAAMEIAD